MMSSMYYFFLLLVVFSCSVVSEDCRTFDFENGLQDFNNKKEVCDSLDMWKFGNYSDLSMKGLKGFHPKSSVFASPVSSLSCMSSPMFQMKTGGTLEINVYLKPNASMYQLLVIILQYVENSMDTAVLSQNLVLTEGWQSVNLTVGGSDSFLGYVSLIAVADSSVLFVDSFRYIPQSLKEEECQLYKDVEVKDPEEDKKPSYSIFYMFKIGFVKMFN